MENGPRTTPDEERATGLVEVRAASPSDVRAIAEFQTACWNEAYRDVVPSDYLDRVDACTRAATRRERIETGSRRVAVGHVGDALAGVVSWATSTEPGVPALELTSLYVAAAHHGTGLAGALLTHALGDAPAYLWVFEANPRALAFYAKWDFVFDGHRTIDPDTGVWERRLVRS
jgi:GNAT superfamily N-acetyltransferase